MTKRNKFSEYVTSAAFRLELSRSMCMGLADIFVCHQGNVRKWSEPNQFYIEELTSEIYRTKYDVPRQE